jgi:hypothetical protein
MGNNEARLGATCFVWTAMTIITVAMLAAGQFSFVIALVFAFAAFGTTAAMWNNRIDSQEDKAQAEKAKRRGRLEKFVDQLDDEELDELRARLMSESDGEAVSLDELMNEVKSRRESSS